VNDGPRAVVFSLMRVVAQACLLAVAVAANAADQADAAPGGLRVVQVQGVIHAKLVDAMRKALAPVDPNRWPAGVLILIDSPGGDGLAAIEVGRMLRQARAHVFVTGRCASACVFVFAGGAVRAAPEESIGIHSPRMTRWVRDVGPVAVDPADLRAAALLDAANRRVREYLKEMGVPDVFFEAMTQVPSDTMRYLTRTELAGFGLISAEPQGQAALEAQDECEPGTVSPQAFARCYRGKSTAVANTP